jgi:hypothetical protein
VKRITISRRTLLAGACQVSATTFLGLLGGCADKKQAAVCADPDQLTESEMSIRASLQYTDQSPDLAKACGGCAYFPRAADTAECGNCQILNGPVHVKGHCTSWSARA